MAPLGGGESGQCRAKTHLLGLATAAVWNFRRRCRGRRKLAAAFRVSRIASRSRRWVVATRPSFAMPVVITDEPWVPAQEKFESGADFRSFARAKESRKRAREIEANGGGEDDEMVDEHEMHRLRKASRPTYHQVVGKASGRAWKEPAKQRAATFMKAQVGGIKSWDDRMKEKAAKKAFQERIREAKEEAKAGRKAEHDRRAAKKAQKEENRKKNEAAQSIAVKQTVAKKTGAKSKERKLQKALKMT